MRNLALALVFLFALPQGVDSVTALVAPDSARVEAASPVSANGKDSKKKKKKKKQDDKDEEDEEDFSGWDPVLAQGHGDPAPSGLVRV